MNWQDKCEVIYHFRNDESILIVTKPEYRFDGCHAVVLDSKTAELALSNNANWKTINGARVLVGTKGSVVVGMDNKFGVIPTANNPNGFSGIKKGKKIYDDIDEVLAAKADDKKPIAQYLAEYQGYTGRPRLVEKSDFDQIAQESGFVAYRVINDGVDVATGKFLTAKEYHQNFIYDGHCQLNGTGQKQYGAGIYLCSTGKVKKGLMPNKTKIDAVANEVAKYGDVGKSAILVLTLDKSAKVANYKQIVKQLNQEDWRIQAKYQADEGAYAIAKGYDAMRIPTYNDDMDYVTVFNRTKLVVLNNAETTSYLTK